MGFTVVLSKVVGFIVVLSTVFRDPIIVYILTKASSCLKSTARASIHSLRD